MKIDILESLFKRIDRIKNSSKLVFFKGFDVDTLNIIFNKYERFYEGSYFSEDGIDILKLNKDKKKIMKAVLVIEEGTYVGLYEEFIFLSGKIEDLYDGEIIIVDNNYFDNIYPSPYIEENNLLREYKQFLDKESAENDDSEISIIGDYLSNIVEIENKIFISYLDRTEEIEVTKINLIDCREVNIELKEILDPKDYIEFSSANTIELLNLKSKILDNEIAKNSSINILTEKSILKTTELLNSLKSLVYTVGNEYNIYFYYTSKFVRREVKKEFTQLLKKHWNSDSFRMLDFYENPDESIEKVKISQGELIQTIVEQVEESQKSDNYSDVFITAPTGAGKSVLFQIPAVYLADKHNLVSIVISPLKALMVDQVRQLKEKGINCVEYINSDLTQRQKEEVLERVKNGQVSILYVSPEFLLAYDIRSIIGEKRNLGLLVIDEAHLVTTWGRDFRVDYWYLGTYIKKLRSNFSDFGNFIIASFTATAVYGGNDDMVYETIDSMYMRNPIKYLGNTRRTNIRFRIRNWREDKSYSEEREQKTTNSILDFIKENKKAIVYAPYRRHIDELIDMIPREQGHKVVKYYGNLEASYKEYYEEKFRKGEANVMLATKAFGMGVDVSDIEVVYHHAPTGNLCDYVQEIGRAGRDKSLTGLAVQDFNPKDLSFSKILYGLSSMKQYQLKEMIKKLYSIYRQNKRRNFLINAQTFSYLFPDDSNYENKVKNALLLLEKDLEKKYSYPVLIVRPKSLFSKAYAAVPSTLGKKFLKSKYFEYARKISEAQSSKMYDQADGNSVVVQDIGAIYEFDLKRLWEEHYSEMTFPMLKKKFYDLELFDFKEKIVPRYKLTITLDKAINDTKRMLDENLGNIIKCFDKQKRGFFTREEFSETLKEYFPKEAVRRSIINTFVDLFIIKFGEDNRRRFIQKRNGNGKVDREEFRLQSKMYHKILRDIQKKFVELSRTTNGEEELLCKYLAVKDNSQYMMLAYVIEAFSLGAYDVRGGESPEIFVRVNDPSKLRILSGESSNYSNLILKGVRGRQKRSSEILQKFFMEITGDEARWDFVEEYFLGRINVD